MEARHEIKGSAFVTLARWASDVHGRSAVEALVSALPASDRSALVSPLPSAWYPEQVHSRVLRATFEVIAKRDTGVFEESIAQCTALGVQRFARLVMSMASPSFVLRRAPTLWSVIRRGPATLTVVQEGDVTDLHYRGFPFFDDVLYRHYFRALLGALVRPSLGALPDVQLVSHGATWLNVRIAGIA